MYRPNYHFVLCGLILLQIGFFASIAQTQMLSDHTESAGISIQTKGTLLAANRLIMVVEVDFVDTWKLDVTDGYGSIVSQELDTLSMSLRFKSNPSIALIQRLKAERKPSEKGFYYKKIIFAQTIAIDTAQLPIKINANLKWKAVNHNESKSNNGYKCCLLKVEAKCKDIETIHVGWSCSKRAVVCLEDILGK
jgi:hypothetical protein